MRFLIALPLISMLFLCSLGQQSYFELSNDPEYPQYVVLTDVQYNIVPNQYADINCTLKVFEELDESTNVSYYL